MTGASGRLTADLAPDIRLDLRAVWSDARNAFDGFPAPAYVFADTRERGRTREALGYAGLTFPAAAGRLKNRLGGRLCNGSRFSVRLDRRVCWPVWGCFFRTRGGWRGCPRRSANIFYRDSF